MKTTAAESYRWLREAYGEHAPLQDTCERWFRHFKSGNFDFENKERGKQPKIRRYRIAIIVGQKMIRKQKNNSSRNWALVNKLFPIGYEKREKFRRPVNG